MRTMAQPVWGAIIGGLNARASERWTAIGIKLLHNLSDFIRRVFKAAIGKAVACSTVQSHLIKARSQALCNQVLGLSNSSIER